MGMRKAANANSHPAAPVGTPTEEAETVAPTPVEPHSEVVETVVSSTGTNPAHPETPAPAVSVALPTQPAPVEAQVTKVDASEIDVSDVVAPEGEPTPSTSERAASVRDLRPVVDRPAQPEVVAAPPVTRVRAAAPAQNLASVPPLPSAPVPLTAPTPTGFGLQPPSGVRDIAVSKRGKRDYNYSWPKDDVAQMQAAWEHYRPLYRRYWQSQNPRGVYALARSTFFAQALLEAFRDPSAWLGTVRNDARKEPLVGGREQVGLVWPVEVAEQVVDLFETLDRSQFPAGFALTKQHLASAAILHGLTSAEQWYLTVPNDDRHSIPVETDGRLKDNKADRDLAPAPV